MVDTADVHCALQGGQQKLQEAHGLLLRELQESIEREWAHSHQFRAGTLTRAPKRNLIRAQRGTLTPGYYGDPPLGSLRGDPHQDTEDPHQDTGGPSPGHRGGPSPGHREETILQTLLHTLLDDRLQSSTAPPGSRSQRQPVTLSSGKQRFTLCLNTSTFCLWFQVSLSTQRRLANQVATGVSRQGLGAFRDPPRPLYDMCTYVSLTSAL